LYEMTKETGFQAKSNTSLHTGSHEWIGITLFALVGVLPTTNITILHLTEPVILIVNQRFSTIAQLSIGAGFQAAVGISAVIDSLVAITTFLFLRSISTTFESDGHIVNEVFETVAAFTNEELAVERFSDNVNSYGPLSHASQAIKERLLEDVKTVASHVYIEQETGSAYGYTRRVLHEEPNHWSLAVITLRSGQHTHPHDHGGWGCAATVQGIERDRRFVFDDSNNLNLISERDYPPGTGYIFNAVDIHQPVGADAKTVTIALHFIVQENHPPENEG
jgi:predicted metal-dependent enzyme (double-stranded beta helix superfamily)